MAKLKLATLYLGDKLVDNQLASQTKFGWVRPQLLGPVKIELGEDQNPRFWAPEMRNIYCDISVEPNIGVFQP